MQLVFVFNWAAVIYLTMKEKIDEALFQFYLEADAKTIKQTLKEEIKDMKKHNKWKKELITKLRNGNK